ncbi:MAG: tRNA preQ1(34) S-adenosylmethionine ribosyltransferase-isomerase QueA [Bacilli bacterium]|nr:tRNA preQ1(34) S-adenosylmethionine ribosyltransferase-isomerase QueA [Bacilli bacterium]
MEERYDLNYYNYELPEHLIAQTPLKERSASKLLLLNKNTGETKDETFKNITKYLKPGDVLVLNDTKVIPARLIGTKEGTNATIEILLLKNKEKDIWECLAKPAKRLHEGTIITFGNGELKAKINEKQKDGIVEIELQYEGILNEILEKIGTMPLPPYIHEKLKDQKRYQTIYAKNLGSAAAPTAGLHFTEEILKEIKQMGITITYVTLHVGLGTFRPVNMDNILEHDMHSEYYMMNKETADILNKAKKEKRRIIAVGTTSTRTLESIMQKNGKFKESSEETNIFIYPGYTFKAIDGLITNFHLPKSTLVMLVSALSTRDYILNAYAHAVEKEYRFFSFGDAMFITDKF